MVAFGSPTSMGRAIKQAVYEATGGLTVSVGASTTKFVAKVASDHHKPDGLTIVPPDDVRSFLWPQRSSKLWGVGPRATSILANAGLATIADVACAPRELLTALLGKLGAHVHALAHGDDPRLVEPTGAPKSIGHEETFANDILCRDEAMPVLLRAADSVAERLRLRRLVAGGARLKLKTAAFALLTRQHKLAQATSSAGPLYQCALALLMEFPWSEPIRLVGLTAYDLCAATAPAQQELFEPKGARGLQKLDATLDAVRARFGHTAIRRASELPSSPNAKPPRSGG